jgi:uncharacterized RDD family membrane protein YckC
VTERRWTASWLSPSRPDSSGTASTYPGQDLGLPETGPGSVAGVGRRLGAVFIDWLLSELIAITLLHQQYWTIAVFGVEVFLLTALTGFTVGKRLTGIRVARLDGRPVGLQWSLLRTVLLLTVIPPLVYDRDLRGLHDKAANTVVIRI